MASASCLSFFVFSRESTYNVTAYTSKKGLAPSPSFLKRSRQLRRFLGPMGASSSSRGRVRSVGGVCSSSAR